ncbi:MAG: HNH endonuclease [Candidatus Thiodiazotropha sp. (ex Lucinoma borealis)]|nr:HNH endonuclease [Candidatus Thiodiazotropha sp. (ex Lucinoma borealis)]
MYSVGLSKSSVEKYYGAIGGVLSEWALSAELVNRNILEITNKTKFDALSIKISALPIFLERNSTGHSMYSSALSKYSEFLANGTISTVKEDIEEIVGNMNLEETEKSQLISARVGQGKYRKSLLSYWGRCAVTGVKEPVMLLASHIKPWSKCSNEERLDQFNGLLLSPNLDRAFDQGLVSFSENGSIIISPLLSDPETLGIHPDMHIQLCPEHQQYMEYHRANVFKTT